MQHQLEEMLNGGIADGSYHLGNILMDFFNEPEDYIWQIDAGTDEVDMKSSVKSRSIQLARSLRKAGLKPGDVVTVSGVNHLDVHIPFYAAYMNGLPLSGIDPFYKIYEEIKAILRTTRPKVVFCELFNLENYERAVKDLGLETIIVTFGDRDRETSYANFVKQYDNNAPESEFRVATFDTDKVFAWLVSTSGTTGPPKVLAFKHSDVLKILKIYSFVKQEEKVINLNLSGVQWISAYLATLCMISSNQIKLQTSSTCSHEHAIDIINKYKPVICISGPLLFNNILKHEKPCDLTCFKKIFITGLAMNAVSLEKLKARMGPGGTVWNLFAQTECLGMLLLSAPHGPPGNCGTELPLIPLQLVDPTTGEAITEANRTGELWAKGPRFTEYYSNPEATAAAFSPDGWFKTGDLMYRDENGFYFYVDRMSNSFRFRNYDVMPIELEMVIQEHPEVVDACVVDAPHPEDGKQAVACVQIIPGSTLTEQKIKDIVADKLPFHKHLHGGVILVDDFPRTISLKIARAKVRDYVLKLRST